MVFCDFIHIINLHNRAVQTTLFCALLDYAAILAVQVILMN